MSRMVAPAYPRSRKAASAPTRVGSSRSGSYVRQSSSGAGTGRTGRGGQGLGRQQRLDGDREQLGDLDEAHGAQPGAAGLHRAERGRADAELAGEGAQAEPARDPAGADPVADAALQGAVVRLVQHGASVRWT